MHKLFVLTLAARFNYLWLESLSICNSFVLLQRLRCCGTEVLRWLHVVMHCGFFCCSDSHNSISKNHFRLWMCNKGTSASVIVRFGRRWVVYLKWIKCKDLIFLMLHNVQVHALIHSSKCVIVDVQIYCIVETNFSQILTSIHLVTGDNFPAL